MVCLGNICRSPMAAAVATAMVDEAGLGGEVIVESFGTAGYHEGERANPGADAALRRGGWPAGAHRARRLRPADLVAADLVLCADRTNLADVRRLAGSGVGTAKVRLIRHYDPERPPPSAAPQERRSTGSSRERQGTSRSTPSSSLRVVGRLLRLGRRGPLHP